VRDDVPELDLPLWLSTCLAQAGQRRASDATVSEATAYPSRPALSTLAAVEVRERLPVRVANDVAARYLVGVPRSREAAGRVGHGTYLGAAAHNRSWTGAARAWQAGLLAFRLPNNSCSRAMLTAMRRASSFVSTFARRASASFFQGRGLWRERVAKFDWLRRLSHGLYDYPQIHSRFGPLAPSPDVVAKALSEALVRKTGSSLQVSGAQAAWPIHTGSCSGCKRAWPIHTGSRPQCVPYERSV
jgi:hypothetical protein